MERPTPKVLPPTRIVALALIALLAGGLIYVRFAPALGPVSVPAGAQAGDLVLEPCTYETEKGEYEADCGALVVAENRAVRGSRLIALPVTRIHARSDRPAEPIFYLEGGPGLTNINFRPASRYAEDRDVVLVGYRGVDGSVRLDCPEVASALKRSSDVLSEGSFRAYGDAFRSCANRLTAAGLDLASYGLPQQVDDLEAARIALGYDHIDLLSQSAGTRTAMIYAWRFPESIHRSVMIGVNPPGHFLWDAQATDEQIGQYVALCAEDARCSQRTDDLAASIRGMAADMPDRWLFLPIEPANVRVATFFGLMETTWDGSMPSAPMTLDAWLAASEGDASGFWFQSLLVDFLVPNAFVWGQYAAAASLDAAAASDYFSSGTQDRASIGFAGTAFGWGGGRLSDSWPVARDASAYSRMKSSDVETLLIGGALDTSTPPLIATKELLPYLPNGHQVVLPGLGHTASFFAAEPEAGTRLINAFFDSGQVDDSLYEPQIVDLKPGLPLTALGTWAAAVMISLALMTVLSLLWMASRVRMRGGFGPKASALVRSMSPLVLGLGGWCLGVLAILAGGLSVPLDGEGLAIVAVGAPVALGVYWGWVHPGGSMAGRAGFAAAAVAGLLGAWLGFNATEGMMALFTAIVGAAIGANVALIILDASGARGDHRRLVAPSGLRDPTGERVRP